MKILILLNIALFLFTGCASEPITEYPEDRGIACFQTEEQEAENKKTCLRINSYSDPVKWHKVKPWHVLPGIPD